MPRGEYRFPIEYTAADVNETIDGYGWVAFDEPTFAIQHMPYADQRLNPFRQEAQSVRIPATETRVDLPESILIYRESQTLRNTMLLESDVGDILFTPVSETDDILVKEPYDATSYANGGEIFYTRMFVEMESLRFPAGVRIRESSISGNQPRDAVYHHVINCSISLNDDDIVLVPTSVYDELLSIVDRLGGTVVSRSTIPRVMFQFPYSFSIEALPSFAIIISTDDGRQIQIAQLDPLDYMKPSRNRPNHYYMYLWEAPNFLLSRPTIDKILIHIDYANQRIGFADPLVEL